MNVAVGDRSVVHAMDVSVFTVPTDGEESDGTYTWDHTTMVVVQVSSGDVAGFGYTYADRATAVVVSDSLRPIVVGQNPMDVPSLWARMRRAVRNLGGPGICAMAISAVDSALWDLKARLLGVPLAALLGRCRESVPIYGSGGFTNYPLGRLQEQLGNWAAEGIPRVKMKVGRDAKADLVRAAAVREAIGPEVDLFVDANGAYQRKAALAQSERFRDLDVTWFEEPVSSDDLEGLRLLRDRFPAGMSVAAGEYGYTPDYFVRMLKAGAVDVLQADATRCCGISGFLKVGALCEAFGIPLSSHCAPALHLHPSCAVPGFVHSEYFFDHVRIESLFFDGISQPVNGALIPDLTRPGNGLVLKTKDAERYRAE